LAHQTAGLESGAASCFVARKCAERLDFTAAGHERVSEAGGVEAGGELMSAMPVARCSGHAGDSLQAASDLVEALEIVAGGAVDEKDVGLRALRDVVEDAFVGGDAKIEERVGEPDLIFERGEVAVLVAGDSGGNRVESIEAEVGTARNVVEKTGVENMLGRDVVLEAEEIVAGPLFPSVGAGGLAFDDGEGVLNADGIGKPEAAALDGS